MHVGRQGIAVARIPDGIPAEAARRTQAKPSPALARGSLQSERRSRLRRRRRNRNREGILRAGLQANGIRRGHRRGPREGQPHEDPALAVPSEPTTREAAKDGAKRHRRHHFSSGKGTRQRRLLEKILPQPVLLYQAHGFRLYHEHPGAQRRRGRARRTGHARERRGTKGRRTRRRRSIRADIDPPPQEEGRRLRHCTDGPLRPFLPEDSLSPPKPEAKEGPEASPRQQLLRDRARAPEAGATGPAANPPEAVPRATESRERRSHHDGEFLRISVDLSCNSNERPRERTL
mmetsp:Transcript_730/g.1615  ORF Transcript_730/g.1615 Transcript_730/m.1615 type:complete len:290 (+) Transcript_730:315-1184(+)